MKYKYPISSKELNDRLLMGYENLVTVLGYNEESVVYSGVYDRLDKSGELFVDTESGIPHIGSANAPQLGSDLITTSESLVSLLHYDYVYRKLVGVSWWTTRIN
jgi:hypothetical protein